MSTLAPVQELTLLNALRAGQSAVVEAVVGVSELAHRLREMGLRVGATIQMIQPGTTCLVRLGEHRLGLRASELAGVLVRPEERP